MAAAGSPLASPGATRALLEAYGLATKHSLGQNFLVNNAVIEKIMALAELSPDEQAVVDLLRKAGDLQADIIAVRAALPINRLTALLFTLEMKGVVRPLAGGTYHLIN